MVVLMAPASLSSCQRYRSRICAVNCCKQTTHCFMVVEQYVYFITPKEEKKSNKQILIPIRKVTKYIFVLLLYVFYLLRYHTNLLLELLCISENVILVNVLSNLNYRWLKSRILHMPICVLTPTRLSLRPCFPTTVHFCWLWPHIFKTLWIISMSIIHSSFHLNVCVLPFQSKSFLLLVKLLNSRK